VAGEKVPLVVSVMPVPLQVPPEVAALRLNGAVPRQTGAVFAMVTLDKDVTVTITVSVAPQVPLIA